MNISIFHALLFGLSYLLALTGIFLFQKKQEKLNGIVWAVLSIVTMMGYHTLIASFMKIVQLPISTIVIAIFDLLLGAFCWYSIVKKNKRQAYDITRYDVIISVVILMVGIYFMYREFTFQLDLGYITSDPGVHYGLAMDVLREGKTTGMFFAEINNALFISVFAPFLSSLIYCYKVFIVSDVFMFLLSGFMCYVMVREYLDSTITKAIGLFALIIYMVGYPLNNMLFGFIYLGMSVTVIAYIMILTKYFVEDMIDKRILIPLLGLGCLSLVLCYMLFAPIIWVIVFCCIAFYFYQKKVLFSKDVVLLMLAIFLIPTIFAIKFCFLDYFIGRDLDISSTISNEGGIYKDFFSNFILPLPLAMFGLLSSFKEKKFHVTNVFTIGFFLFITVMFFLMYQGYVSEYYYFKAYYPFWLMYFVLVFQGIYYACKLPISVIFSMVSALLVIVGINRLNLERRMLVNHPTFTSEKSRTYLDIYLYNAENLISHTFYSEKLIDLYRYAMDECMPNTKKPIPMYLTLPNYQDWYWFESFTGMDSSSFYTWDIGEKQLQKKVKNGDADYIIVKYHEDLYHRSRGFFDKYKLIYGNEEGCIYQLTNLK